MQGLALRCSRLTFYLGLFHSSHHHDVYDEKMGKFAFRNYLGFVFTGLMGASLGPMLSTVIGGTANGGWLVMQSLAMTAGIFFFASGYVLTTKKDLSFMGGFLMTGLWVLIGSIVAMWIAGFFGVEITGFSLAISAAAVLLFSMFILYDTSSIVQGHQTNYVYATVGLYLNLFNLFVHLLSLFGFANDD